jgi:RNA 3'-terminal phosphate cyclase (ATP)
MESKISSQYSKESPLIIDGSILEGGGQILRISISLSYLLGIPIKIHSIRSKRDNPGLQRQHLACTQFIINLYNSEDYTGLSLNSSQISLVPTKLQIKKNNGENIKCTLNSAGSIGLMIQELLPCILYSSISNDENDNVDNVIGIILTGGTLVKFSPTIYYLNEILFPILEKNMNIKASCDIIKNGIYPMGLGEVIFNVDRINKKKEEFIHPITITERGKFLKAEIRFCYTNNFRFKIEPVCDTIYKGAKKIIRNEFNQNGYSKNEDGEEIDFNEEEIIKEERIDLGDRYFTFYYQVVMIYENTRIKGDFMISEKKGNFIIDDIIDKCIDATFNTVSNYEICLDEHTVDHLIIFMALAKGISKIKVGEISLHTKTAIEIVKKFISGIKINITPGEDKKNITNVIEIEGIGY